jgi:O-antigen/teichoic acid export membrane protein
MQSKIITNGLWNVVNGSSGAVVAVLVPPVLTRLLTPEAYGAWAIALQIGTYVSLFGFGLQMAVGRYVAYAEARQDIAQRDGIVSTAFWFLIAGCILGWMAVCAVALVIYQLLPNLSPTLGSQTQAAVILVGLALAINLPTSVFAAVFIGQHRSEVPAKIQGIGRLLLALCLILGGYSGNLAVLGLIYAIVSIATALVLWRAWRERTYQPRLSYKLVSRNHGKELAGFCISLTIWNFATLLVSGLDLLIVGRWDYANTPYFAISVTLTTLVAGIIGSLANALVPAAASMPENGSGKDLQTLLSQGSRFIMAASIFTGVPLILGGSFVLQTWLGPSYSLKALPLLTILVSATMLRNAALPYVTLAIGTANQKKLILIPLTEGAVSLVTSLLLVVPYGAHGVAIAKLIGGITGVALLIFNHPLEIALNGYGRWKYLYECIFKPASALIPILFIVYASTHFDFMNEIERFILVVVTALLCVYQFTLSSEDRRILLLLLKSRFAQRMGRPDV